MSFHSCPWCGGWTNETTDQPVDVCHHEISWPNQSFYPWNDEHPCFAGDFDSTDPFDHDMKYQDTSQGDEIYFQHSHHYECTNCGHCESDHGSHYDDF